MTSEAEQFQPLSVEETAESFIPEFNGMSIWTKLLVCQYCEKNLVDKVVIFKWSGPDLRFMCPECFRSMMSRV